MALEDKKSNLQPSSVKAQQYRLQFSNLQGRANEAIKYNQAPIQVPGGSLFQGGPAPVALSAPVAQQAQAPTVVKSYKTKAAVLDGNTYFTSSIGDVDLNGVTSGSLSFAFMIKPDVVPPREKQYLLHTYTGSFASHSLEITISKSPYSTTTLEMRSTNAGAYVRYFANIPPYQFGAQENGYTLVEISKDAQFLSRPSSPADFATYVVRINNAVYYMSRRGIGTLSSHNLPLADQLYIGGTPYTAGANFSGSIAFAMIEGPTKMTSDKYTKLRDGEIAVGSIIPQVRAYTFDSSGAVEDPGTLANVNVTLGVTGSYSTTAGYR